MNTNFKKMLTTALAIAVGVFVFQIVMKALGQAEQKLYATGGQPQNLPCNAPSSVCEVGCSNMNGSWNAYTMLCTVPSSTAPVYPFRNSGIRLSSKFFS